MKLVAMKGIHKYYQNNGDRVTALQDLNLDIRHGEFVAVMGASGSGKSTLLSVLGGVNRPTEGSVIVDAIDIYQLPLESLADFRREYLGFIFQSFQLLPYLSVIENVMLPLSILGIPNKIQLKMVEEILERIGLLGKTKRLPGQLSGGEQERVAIARALVNSPPLLLADEPTGNLDSQTGKDVMTLLTSLNEDGQTIVMVTHDPEVAKYSMRTTLLKDGRNLFV